MDKHTAVFRTIEALAESNDTTLPENLIDQIYAKGFRDPRKIVNLVVPLLIFLKTQDYLDVSREEMLEILKGQVRETQEYARLKWNTLRLVKDSLATDMIGSGLFEDVSNGIMSVVELCCNQVK